MLERYCKSKLTHIFGAWLCADLRRAVLRTDKPYISNAHILPLRCLYLSRDDRPAVTRSDLVTDIKSLLTCRSSACAPQTL